MRLIGSIIFVVLSLSGCGWISQSGGYGRVIVYPPHNEYIHSTTHRIEKWVGTLGQRFKIKTLDIKLEGNYHLTGDWPEDSRGYGWGVGVADLNLYLRWPNNKPLSIWYHKQQDFLLSNHTKTSDSAVCNCTYGNSVGLQYSW